MRGIKIKNLEVTTGPNYPQHVHDHRAPTDKSVELLRDMEKEISDNHYKKFIFQDNEIKGTVIQNRSFLGWEVVILFKVNGKEIIRQERIEEMEFSLSPVDAYKKLIDAVVDQFRTMLTRNVIDSYPHERGERRRTRWKRSYN